MGGNPRCLVATTPRPTKLIRELLAREGRAYRAPTSVGWGEYSVGAAIYPDIEISIGCPMVAKQTGRRSCIRRKEAKPGAKKPVPAAAVAALNRRRAS